MENLCNDIRSVVNSIYDGFYDGHFARLFPCYTIVRTLTPEEMLRLLARIQADTTVNLVGYIAAVQEISSNERAEQLRVLMMPTVATQDPTAQSSAEPAVVATESVVGATLATPAIAASALIALDPETIKNAELRAKMHATLDSDEHRLWHKKVDQNSRLQSTLCSYLIHKKEYELLEFMLEDTDYYRDGCVSGELATAGDLDGLKWLWTNQTKCPLAWSAGRVFSNATVRGHLPILIWMNHLGLDAGICMTHWQSAVSSNHLNIVQWYFIAFPSTAKQTAGEIFKMAKAKNAHDIVAWMNTVGLSTD